MMQEPEPVDWEYYRNGIGSRLVDMYKEAYDSNLFFFFYMICCIIFFISIRQFCNCILFTPEEGFSFRMILILWWCWFWCCFAGIQIPKYVDTVTPQYKPKFDALVSTNIILRFLLHHWLLFSCFFRTFLGLKDLLLVSLLLLFCLQFLQETEKMIFLYMVLKFWNINSDV